jgi:hypothetical protein
VRFTRRKAPTDLVYAVEVTTDFATWLSGPNSAFERHPAMDDGNGVTETATFLIPVNPSLGGQKFARVRVTRLVQ